MATARRAAFSGWRGRSARARRCPRTLELVHARVGEQQGPSEELGTTMCPFELKYSRKLLRISRESIAAILKHGAHGTRITRTRIYTDCTDGGVFDGNNFRDR